MAKKILVVIGTRPEAIKLAPVLEALRERSGLRVRVCVTAQHRQLLDQMLRVFGIRPHHDLDLMRRGQSPVDVAAGVLRAFSPVLEKERPDLVVVQGDTTTALAAGLAAFYRRIPVAHVEAGLRSHDPANPHPEEKNRVMIDHLSTLLFAPTASAKRNLAAESLRGAGVFVTGNTVVDALDDALRRLPSAAPKAGKRTILVTLHRRESFGAPLRGIFQALREIADRHADVELVYPVHPNPAVHETAHRLLRHPRIRLLKPLPYLEFLRLMSRAYFVVTDSGGLQEESAGLHKPVLVVRKTTERPEIIRSGGGRLIGVSGPRIVREIDRLLRDPALHRRMSRAPNPYGDGRASRRIAAAITHFLGRGTRPRDWGSK